MEGRTSQEFKKRVLTSKIILFFLLLAFIWTTIACVKIIYKRKQITKEIENLQKQILELQNENQKLSITKSFLTNPAYLEKEAKKRLNLKKEGEEVVIVSGGQNTREVEKANNKNSEEATEEFNADKPQKESNPKKWWRYFFH